MKRIEKAVSFCLILLISAFGGTLGAQEKPRPCPNPSTVSDTKFRPGQVWRYNTRDHEKDSTLTILRIESLADSTVIVHIRVDKVRLRNCTGGPEPDTFQHMPFARGALDRSVTKLVKEGEVPEFQDGYNEWRKACGGIYTITVSEAVAVAEETFRKNLGCPSPS